MALVKPNATEEWELMIERKANNMPVKQEVIRCWDAYENSNGDMAKRLVSKLQNEYLPRQLEILDTKLKDYALDFIRHH